MLSTTPLHQLATYHCIASLPTFVAPPALAKETVYMPSAVANRVLGPANMSQELEQLKVRQAVQTTL